MSYKFLKTYSVKFPPISALHCCELFLFCLAAEQDTWQPQEFWDMQVDQYDCCSNAPAQTGCHVIGTLFYRGLPERFGQITNLIWLRLRLPQDMKQSVFDGSARLALIPGNIKILLENITNIQLSVWNNFPLLKHTLVWKTHISLWERYCTSTASAALTFWRMNFTTTGKSSSFTEGTMVMADCLTWGESNIPSAGRQHFTET